MPRSIAPHSQPPRRRHPLAVALSLVVIASLFATAFSFAVSSREALAATAPLTTASVTPDTSLFYAAVNLDRTSDQWSRVNELLARIGQNNAIDNALSNPSMSASSKDIADAVLGGEVAVVLEKFPQTGNLSTSSIMSDVTNPSQLTSGVTPQGYALILAPSDQAKTYSAILDSMNTQASNDGATVEKTTYKGVEIDAVAPVSTTTATSSTSGSGQAVAKVKNFIIFGTLPEDLHGIIDTANGDTPALAANEHFKSLQGALNKEFISFGFVNGPAMLASMQASDPTIVSQLGSETESLFKSFSAFAVWADNPGLRVDTMSVSATGTPLPQMKSIDDTMAKKVSADSLVYSSSSNLGQNPGLQALALAFAQAMMSTGGSTAATPAAAMTQADTNKIFEESAAMLGFNLKTDFLDQLVGNYAFALTVQNVFAGTPTINGILVSDTKDEPTITNAVTRISKLIQSGIGQSGTVSSKTVGGSKVTEIDLSSSGVPLTVQLGVVNKQFVIGLGGGLDEYVNGPAKPLADDANYQLVMGTLPKDHTAVAYLNVQQLLPLIQGYMDLSSGAGMSAGLGATPAAQASPAMSVDQFAAVKGIGLVSFNKGDMVGSSMILYIAPK